METKEYEMILDALQMTAVYVIREDNHEILYYNKRVKDVAPNVEKGMICHELFHGTCENCPLLHIGDKKEARSVSYDDPFGKAVEIAATRIVWKEKTPAFLIAVTPHAEGANYVYHKVLKANLTNDSYSIVKVDGEELRNMEGRMGSLSEWMENVAQGGYIYEEDLKRYQKFTRIDRLRKRLKDGERTIHCIYRRKVGKRFRWHTVEVIPASDYRDENQSVMIYVKDVHEIFRNGLELEEVNVRNQEIINALSEMNFAIYVVDLQSGGVNIVRTTEMVRKHVNTDIFLWDEIFSGNSGGYIAPEDQEEFKRKFCLDELRQAQERGEEKKTIVCRAFLYGSWRYISVTVFFRESEKQGGYAIITFQDVDEKTKNDMERTRNDRRMAAIIKSRYSILNTVDLETGICERVYLEEDGPGKKVEGNYSYYIQKVLNEFVAEADRQSFEDAFLLENLRKRAEEVQDYKEEIYQYRYKGSPVMWLEEHVLYLRQGNKTVVNILGRDITAEKAAEESMRKDSMEKASIINSLSSMFFATYYVDLQNDSFRTVIQKEEVGNVLGDEENYTQGLELYARNFIHPDDREEYLKHLDRRRLLRMLSGEDPLVAFEYRMLPETGRHRSWIRATVVLAETDADGSPVKALYAAQDVTESKLRQEREQQALREACEAANHANAAKSEFMSRMSHDIRTPMNAIIGMTAIAGRYLNDQERVADCLGKITVSSKHLLSLINEVLDMSKIESGKINLAEEEINLSNLIGDLVTMIRPSMEEKGHHFNVRITNVEHEHVIGDPMRLQQIFMNILGNSVKYTPEGGNIEVEISEKPSHTFGYSNYEFVFQDNGIGMSREFQQRLFEPFSRAEDTETNNIEGTGLGMTIARNIARRMNGDITVESEPGKGTRFTVMLSFRIMNATEPDTERLVDLPVLVADDDKSAAEMTCLILGNIGMKGEYVLNGREAVELVCRRHQSEDDYFAVILDWKMPDVDGIETARAIRREVGPDIPIIILSAYDWSSVEEEARSAGINGFISKPLFRSRLVYLFNQIAGNEQQEPEEEPDGKVDLTGKRILLAEDNELNREIAEEVIGQTGVTVESVENGKKALERFAEMPENYYDLIFMDIQMPVMNGYEATQEIRDLPRRDASSVPIIAMTANAFAEDVQRSRNAGMNEHLTKPLDVKQLMKCMQRWIGGKK